MFRASMIDPFDFRRSRETLPYPRSGTIPREGYDTQNRESSRSPHLQRFQLSISVRFCIVSRGCIVARALPPSTPPLRRTVASFSRVVITESTASMRSIRERNEYIVMPYVQIRVDTCMYVRMYVCRSVCAYTYRERPVLFFERIRFEHYSQFADKHFRGVEGLQGGRPNFGREKLESSSFRAGVRCLREDR